jgi:hypothetical protein
MQILKCVQPLLKALLRTLHLNAIPAPDDTEIVLHGPVWQEMLESNRCLKKALHIVPFHWKPLRCLARVIQQYVTGVT